MVFVTVLPFLFISFLLRYILNVALSIHPTFPEESLCEHGQGSCVESTSHGLGNGGISTEKPSCQNGRHVLGY